MTFTARSHHLVLGAFSLALSTGLFACGGTTTPSDDGTDSALDASDADNLDGVSDGGIDGDDASDGANDGAPSDGTVGADVITDGPSDGPSDARPVCSAEPTKVRCDDCCQKEHKEGFATLTTALVGCACTDSICKTVCASTGCATPPSTPDSACKACFNEAAKAGGGSDAGGVAGKCNGPVTTACKGDPKCVAYVACAGSCPGG